MKLYAWQPTGHGQLSFFVMADNEKTARTAVEAEIKKRESLPLWNTDRITEYESCGWGTEDYELTIADVGEVLTNYNE